MEVVDTHQHIGHLNDIWEPSFHHVEPDPDDEFLGRVRAMDQMGVTWAVIQPSHGYLKPDGVRDTMRVNDRVAAYRQRDPKRFPIALGTVEPTHGERSLEEIDRVKHVLGLNGLSWHHRFQGCLIASKWMWPILRRMADLKLTPFIHTFSESRMEAPHQLERLANEFPNLTFVSHDAFYSSEKARETLRMAERTPNILWDIGGPMSFDVVESWVRNHGSERLIFSTGITYGPSSSGPRHSNLLESILRSDIKPEDKANILSRNVRKLFGMPAQAGDPT